MKRLMLLAGAVVVLGVSLCWAQSANGPTTQPVPQLVVAPPQSAAPATYSSVLVLPFTPISGGSEWMGKGIQEDLATELVRQSRLTVLTPADVPVASDDQAAAKLGRDHGASLVAFGSFQIVDSDVRINGRVIEAATGRSVAALKATGPRSDLFHMEDLLAAQAVAALPPSSIRVGYGDYAPSGATLTTTPAASSSYTVEPYDQGGYYVQSVPQSTPTYDYNYPASPNSYAYTYPPYSTYPYDYGYYGSPFWGGGFVFIGNGGFHHHFDGGHWNGGGWHGNVSVGGSVGVRSGAPATSGFGGRTFSSGAAGFHGGFSGGMHGGGGHR